MGNRVRVVQWAEFIASLKAGETVAPFLVRESADPDEWFLYGVFLGGSTGDSVAEFTQVFLARNNGPRSWRTVEGVLAVLEKEFPELPSLVLFTSLEAVAAHQFPGISRP